MCYMEHVLDMLAVYIWCAPYMRTKCVACHIMMIMCREWNVKYSMTKMWICVIDTACVVRVYDVVKIEVWYLRQRYCIVCRNGVRRIHMTTLYIVRYIWWNTMSCVRTARNMMCILIRTRCYYMSVGTYDYEMMNWLYGICISVCNVSMYSEERIHHEVVY